MADPTPYTVSYSFNGFQALNPDEPLPAARLDTELANIAAASAEVSAAVTSVRRADGGIQNAVVTWDSLNDDVKARITNTDPRVTVPDLNPVAFATQAEAEAGVTNDRLMTPLRVQQAIGAQRAVPSQAQAEAGVDNTTAMTPLRTKQAIDAQRAIASQAAAETGTDNAAVMTPLRTKNALDGLRAAYTGQVALTWGSIAAGASATQAITVAGAVVGDRVILGLPSSGVDAGLVAQAWVSSANTVTVRLTNITGGALTPYSGAATTMSATAVRF